MDSEITPHICLDEPNLIFHPDLSSDREIHPLRGLLRFGPYTAGVLPDPIRIATIAPANESAQLFEFVKRLNRKHSPRERRQYLPEWPGYSAVFGVHVRSAGTECHVELDSELELKFNDSPTPHIVLADGLVRSIQRLQPHRNRFDVVFIYIPQRWSPGYNGSVDDDFDLHDYLKAFTASIGIPIQLVREDSAISYHCQASVMWRIGLALYVKAGGIPWKLADSDTDTAYIGISYAVRPMETNSPRFVTCCSQVFDSEGSGLEFIAYDTHEVNVHRDNPFLSRTEMFRVMSRSLDLYRRRHAGQSPRRVMVHKNSEFKPDEIEGSLEAFHLCEAVDLVQVVEDVGWHGVRIDGGRTDRGKGVPASYPVTRGTLVDLGPRDALLWTHGDVSNISRNGPFFKGAKSTPSPLKLVRHAGHGPWDDTVQAIMGLSKMNWNNDSLYDTLPVTMAYAKVLARVVKRMPRLNKSPYQFRFFM